MTTFGRRSGGGRRRAARESLPLIAVFTTLTRSHSAELVDISPMGARLQGSELPGDGEEEVVLCVDRVRAFGRVVWASGDEFAMVFDDPLDDEYVDALRDAIDGLASPGDSIRADDDRIDDDEKTERGDRYRSAGQPDNDKSGGESEDPDHDRGQYQCESETHLMVQQEIGK